MTDAVTVLRQEITNLEQEIAKRRQAVAVLTGSAAPVKTTPATAAQPAPGPRPPAGPTLGERIIAHLNANKGKLLTSAQVADALTKTDKNVKRENVQRRLGELLKQKKVKRENGTYGVA